MNEKNPFWSGAEAAHRRAMMKGAGYGDADIQNKPHIGIPNSYMEGSPGTAHLRQLAEAVKQGIWAAGGVPVEFGIPATCGNVAVGSEEMKYEQVARDVVAMSIEVVTRVHHFDGLCMLATCDNIIAGTYLAAARLDLPAMVVTGGSMMPGSYCGKQVVEAELNAAVMGGQKEAVLAEMEECVCPSFGACPSMGTANTMQMIGEVLNLVLPGTATIPAADNSKLRRAREAGAYMVQLVKKGLRPSQLITRETILNAIMFDMAVAGSTNAVLHLLAIARELGLDIRLEDFEKYSKEIFCINGVIPNGPYTVVDFHRAGGVLAVMKQLESRLFRDVPTMQGETWGQLLSRVPARVSDVIGSLERPRFQVPGLQVLRGNLAPNGAIIRPTGVPEEMRVFSGTAKVYDNDSASKAAIDRGEIQPGDVIVIRYEGCKGAPGMKEEMLTTDALIGRGLDKCVGLVTDARFSGFNYGAIVGHVSPEACDGGPIALVEDGDRITIDTVQGTLTLEVPEEELEARRRQWVCPPPKVTKGVLALYAKTCRPAEEGGAMQLW